ncbi:hypothetical protein PHLGIDRAFT_130573 [Phlebiopsis gigantea 11061_1 CR5-6]|uniref:Deacetylase sirtuin-type domain-containing protein n=1 Tax=Phlebiopsis gigantea (strain 11061_1 CR5-6) TaxID=745531 RepID=A0A0C3PCB9_PHLG1|nr:hypothetical protein PHLGIDRAFT_130573 [Phlebiopsis gigantea 11061_1 CR5-6]
MDPQSPTAASSMRLPPNTTHAHSPMYAFQVRAFVEASEVVDADPDTIEDILDGFDEDTGDDIDVQGEQADADDQHLEWEALLQEAHQAWTKDEVKQMMVDLKEHGMAYFIDRYVIEQVIPIPKVLYAFGVCLCPELRLKRRKTLLYFLEVAMSRELQAREKQTAYNTIDDAVDLIKQSRNIVILTGAGISVSCGIPDFRSTNGLYAQLQEKGEYDLDDPQQMFDIHYFREKPSVFYQIYPSNFIPSSCHRFIKLIEDKGKLLRNYTQNIDTLETRAGVRKVLQCHGSFATASCINCKLCVPGNAIEDDIMNHRVPVCKACSVAPAPLPEQKPKKKGKKKNLAPWESDGEEEPDIPDYPPGIMKPDITFFGEKLTDAFEKALLEDRPKVDLLLVVGTSLKVSPVSEILTHLPHSVPQILINKTPVKHINPDIVLLGNADEILDAPQPNLRRKRSSDAFARAPRRVANSHVWLFEGAEGGKWVDDVEKKALGLVADSESESEEESQREGDVEDAHDSDVEPQAKRARKAQGLSVRSLAS